MRAWIRSITRTCPALMAVLAVGCGARTDSPTENGARQSPGVPTERVAASDNPYTLMAERIAAMNAVADARDEWEPSEVVEALDASVKTLNERYSALKLSESERESVQALLGSAFARALARLTNTFDYPFEPTAKFEAMRARVEKATGAKMIELAPGVQRGIFEGSAKLPPPPGRFADQPRGYSITVHLTAKSLKWVMSRTDGGPAETLSGTLDR